MKDYIAIIVELIIFALFVTYYRDWREGDLPLFLAVLIGLLIFPFFLLHTRRFLNKIINKVMRKEENKIM